jgi:hypothetical protein
MTFILAESGVNDSGKVCRGGGFCFYMFISEELTRAIMKAFINIMGANLVGNE